MTEMVLHRVPGGKQVADILTKDMSSNQVERMKTGKVSGRRISSYSPKDLNPVVPYGSFKKSARVTKKELASAADITDAPGTQTEIREGVLEAKADEDMGEEDLRERRVKGKGSRTPPRTLLSGTRMRQTRRKW